jgi:transposase
VSTYITIYDIKFIITIMDLDMLYELREDQWEKIKESLPGKAGDRGRSGEDNRGFIRAVMWIARTGAPWRSLPAEYGKWSTVHKRFIRWARAGVWQMIFNTLAADEDTEWLMIDSTMIRAHQHSAGARKKYRDWYSRPRVGKV